MVFLTSLGSAAASVCTDVVLRVEYATTRARQLLHMLHSLVHFTSLRRLKLEFVFGRKARHPSPLSKAVERLIGGDILPAFFGGPYSITWTTSPPHGPSACLHAKYIAWPF